MSEGYILLHRSVFTHPIFKEEPYTEVQAWLWLISQACYAQHRVRYKSKMIELKRGEVPTSYRKLQEQFKWGAGKVASFLKLLKNEQMIGTQTGTGFLIITICNYSEYQDSREKSGTLTEAEMERKRNASGTQTERTEIKENKIKERDRGYQSYVDAYNEVAKKRGLPPCRKLSSARLAKLKARLKYGEWDVALQKLDQSVFCHGKNDRGWRADIDFLLGESTYIKLLEGKYDGKAPEVKREVSVEEAYFNARFKRDRIKMVLSALEEHLIAKFERENPSYEAFYQNSLLALRRDFATSD